MINYILLAALFWYFIYSFFHVAVFNAGEDGHIMGVMLAISEILQWYLLDCDISLNTMAENKVLKIEILTVVNVHFCKIPSLHSSVIVVHVNGWDTGHKAHSLCPLSWNLFRCATFDFNQSSLVGIIIIITNDDMKQSCIYLLFKYCSFNCCYLHGVGRIEVVTVELQQFF